MVDALPRAMYRRAEARAYAEAVGLDPDVILTELRLAGERRTATATSHADIPDPRVDPVRSLTVVRRDRPTPLSDTHRAGRALVVLLVGCAALWWDRPPAPQSEPAPSSEMAVPVVDPASIIGEAVRIAEPPAPAPSMRRVLFEPSVSVGSQQSPRTGRLAEGVLLVRSTPAGARVTVNGVGWGETPVAIRYLPFGTMRVRVAKPDFGVQERMVQLTPERPSSAVRVTLPALRRPVPARTSRGDMLVITSVPEGARVTVNGIGWGTTPLSIPHLPAGPQRVRLVKEQFHSEERVVNVGEEHPGRIAVTLKPQS